MKAELKRRASLTDAVLALFRAHPGEWLDAHDLARAGGFAAWRTRVADVRKIIKAEGGIIENRQTRYRTDSLVVSEYRYLAHVPLGRAADVPAPDRWPTEGPYQERFELKP